MFHADSYNLRYAAHQFGACANEMRGQAKRYSNSAQHLLQYWKGDAAQSFCYVHEQMAQDMQQLAGALERTASELQTLANRNDHVQELKRQAQQVEWQLQSLNSSDPNYESEAHYYRQRAHDLYYAAEMEARADDERAASAFREIESVMNSLFLHAVQNHSSASASSTPKVHPWWEKAMDFVSGAVYSIASSSSWGLLEWAVDDEADLRSDEYMEGKIFGDYLSTGIGVVTALDGLLVAAGGAAGGVLLSWTGVGAVAGAGVAVAGVAEAGYGAGIAYKGYSNLKQDQALMEARKSQSESVGPGESSSTKNSESTASAKKPLPDWLKKQWDAGNTFNKENRPRYPYNEVEVVVDGQKYVVDSYVPGKEIVSRKYTQLAEIQEKTAFSYLSEFTKKYSSGAKITDGRFNPNALKGGRLEGELVLEVPIQFQAIPQKILDEATKRFIIIRDINGKVYN
ncbi:WXG100 family type VII secretion target [Tumebacillus sp. ITR2]|uniref:WXG100 family type VII secretion target n=1 Tax=Tumebacillus amylolyticus TaxID=2801339 RepID=A0ABS1J6D9_9BACL|nr:WXG100 family type VII secretion target [Tumebacillus amylolyticus]